MSNTYKYDVTILVPAQPKTTVRGLEYLGRAATVTTGRNRHSAHLVVLPIQTSAQIGTSTRGRVNNYSSDRIANLSHCNA